MDEHRDGQVENSIPPQTQFAGGIMINVNMVMALNFWTLKLLTYYIYNASDQGLHCLHFIQQVLDQQVVKYTSSNFKTSVIVHNVG